MLIWLLARKAAILAYILYLPYKTELLNSRRAGYEYFLRPLTVFSDNTCFVKAVDPRNKNNNNNNKMEKWAYFTIRQKS